MPLKYIPAITKSNKVKQFLAFILKTCYFICMWIPKRITFDSLLFPVLQKVLKVIKDGEAEKIIEIAQIKSKLKFCFTWEEDVCGVEIFEERPDYKE
jgi:hypothetical protein